MFTGLTGKDLSRTLTGSISANLATRYNLAYLFQRNAGQQHSICIEGSVWYLITHSKKGKRKVQGVPQSQTAALPRPQEEEETDKSKQAQTEQTYEKH